MTNFLLKLNLLKFRNSFVQTIRFGNAERKCICIPIPDNEILENNGGFYYDALCYYDDKGKFAGRHYIKKYIKKDDFEMMPEEFKDKYEVMGQLTPTNECQIPIVEKFKTPLELNRE